MVIERVSRGLAFSCEQIFDLAADVERYPEFLRWWISARITKREPDRLWVEQALGLGPVRMLFESEAVLRRPERIDVTSADPMFREFRLVFTIAPESPAGCAMRIQAQLDPQSLILEHIVNGVLGSAIDDIIAAFEARAHRLYPACVNGR